MKFNIKRFFGGFPIKIKLFYVFYLFELVCILIGLSYPIVSIIAFMVAAVWIFQVDTKSCFYMLYLLLPLANIFKYAVYSSSLFTYLELVVIVKIILSTKYIPRNTFLSILFLMMIQLVGCNLNIIIFIKQASILFLIYGGLLNKLDVSKVIKYFSLGILSSSIIAQLVDYIPELALYLKEIKVYEFSTDALRFTGLYSDPNFYSSVVILSLIGILTFVYKSKLGKSWLIIAVFLAIFGLQTVSKSFFLMLAVILVLILAVCIQNKSYNILFPIILCFIAFLGLCLADVINIFDNVLARLSTGDISTGRDDIWVEYLRGIVSNPIKLTFGYGIGAELMNGKAAHNTYIDFIYYYGVLGSILWVCFFNSILPHDKSKFFTFTCVSPLVCLLMQSFFLSYIVMYDFAFLVLFVLLMLKSDEIESKGAQLCQNTRF